MIAKSKPIFIIEVPKGNDIAKIRKAVKIDLHDYNVLVFSSPITEIKFNTFYAKDMNEVKFNELKEIVKYAVK